jgi:hypothetical protein
MPEPTHFISRDLPPVSIIRPSSPAQSGAMAAIRGFQNDGLFIGQKKDFLDFVFDLAQEADEARRQY